MEDRIIVWFRQDLRIDDNPALFRAIEASREVVPLFILSNSNEDWCNGGASKWWLHHSLVALEKELATLGLSLVIRKGKPLDVLQAVAKELDPSKLFWNRCYEPQSIFESKEIKERFETKGIEIKTFNGSLLFEPWDVSTKTGGPYQVYTPFLKSCLAMPAPRRPLGRPAKTSSTPKIESLELEALELISPIDWASEFSSVWQPGSEGARENLARFCREGIDDYRESRNIPSIVGTSRLSPHLHFGEISPHQVWYEICDQFGGVEAITRSESGVRTYLQEIVWREFAYHLLYHFPETPHRPLRPVFEHFPWVENATYLTAWQKGLTGYPIVDAGMRELWRTGWMHNRVRMIVSSFLVKNLLLAWQEGANWFWDTLVDADLANNTLGWQWSAGCGADAAPYFRVFNPVLQGEKFDPKGLYVRKYVPELSELPNKYIHQPWSASSEILEKAGVKLGKTYPQPIVELAESRDDALKAYATLKAFRTS